jgi:NAD(P)-dependent dehydrogenase (short-subunit alcohol dehydrogenase family)
VNTPDLSGKRVLLLGAETELGAEIARALAEAGASLALVAASNDPQTAFAVQRLARKVGAPVSQAIDATNEMAVRVMVRQVSKELGGLDAIVGGAGPGDLEPSRRAQSLMSKFGRRELERGGGGAMIEIIPPGWAFLAHLTVEGAEPVAVESRIHVHRIERHSPGLFGRREKSSDDIAAEVLVALAAPPASE